MRRLVLVRHAKSDWSDASLSDFDRPLNARGQRAVGVMSDWISEHMAPVTSLYASPAKRAALTVEGLATVLSSDGEFTFDDALYTFGHISLVNWLHQEEREVEVGIVAHNPALESLIEWLTGEAHDRFPTCALAEVRCHVNQWCDLHAGCGQLMQLALPHPNTR